MRGRKCACPACQRREQAEFDLIVDAIYSKRGDEVDGDEGTTPDAGQERDVLTDGELE